MGTVTYIETDSRDAAFHFSVEEYITGGKAGLPLPVLMLWQTGRCAMLGQNQVAAAELNIEYAKSHGVQIVRRSSGGGTIFTDPGTILYTLITPWPQAELTLQDAMADAARHLIRALGAMGIAASLEGRNDICINSKKVSGFAQYKREGRLCTHGSLLYDADLESLCALLTPDQDKISSKALRSVKSRVTNIKQHLNPALSTHDFLLKLKAELFKTFTPKEYILTADDLKAIRKIYNEKYGNPAWTTGSTPKFSFSAAKRFPQGKAEVCLEVVKGVIKDCCIRGDFLSTIQLGSLEQLLQGLPLDYCVLNAALDGVDLTPYLGDISKNELLSVIF